MYLPSRYVAVQSMWVAIVYILATLRITNAKDASMRLRVFVQVASCVIPIGNSLCVDLKASQSTIPEALATSPSRGCVLRECSIVYFLSQCQPFQCDHQPSGVWTPTIAAPTSCPSQPLRHQHPEHPAPVSLKRARTVTLNPGVDNERALVPSSMTTMTTSATLPQCL